MRTRSRRLVALVGVSVLLVLGGCGGSDDAGSSSAGSSSGPQPCSDWAHGEKITEKLQRAGCQGDGVSTNTVTACTDASGGTQTLLAVGPVYGVVGGKAKYLGAGEDATKSAEWTKLQRDCPAP